MKKTNSASVCGAIALVLMVGGATASAQDQRTVTVPRVPPACQILKATGQGTGDKRTSTGVSDEDMLATARIQQALDSCEPGHSVILRSTDGNHLYLTGPLELRKGVTLVVDQGVVLQASRNPALYDKTVGSCGVVNNLSAGCKPLISVRGVDHAGVMGEGVIDGRGGSKLIGKDVSWWDLAEQARKGGRQQVPRLIVADHADDFTLYQITLKNSPNFHVVYNHGDGFTVWGVKIDTPQRGARNTDGIDPGQGSKDITITRSFIRTGDDNVAIKGGPGGVTNMTVSHNHFYWGHGMSIGSETNGGVSRIRVFDLSLDGPDNGLRIKSNASRGGLVEDVVYDDVCIRNSPNPIVFDTGYTAAGSVQGTSLPTFRNIVFHDVRVEGGGKFSFDGYDEGHRLEARLDGVMRTDAAAYAVSLKHADIELGPGPENLRFNDEVDSTITGKPGNGPLRSCKDMFVPFPAN